MNGTIYVSVVKLLNRPTKAGVLNFMYQSKAGRGPETVFDTDLMIQ